jgi:hypothetical protein
MNPGYAEIVSKRFSNVFTAISFCRIPWRGKMRVSAKFISDLVLLLLFIQAFVLLCLEEQILYSTRLLGAFDDDNERLEYTLVQQKALLEGDRSAHRILDCAISLGLTDTIPYQPS